MRTLKKSLCLVLALVMVLGLFVVGANAAYTPYGDEADINYIDAVQVLTGLGVVEGRTSGNFDPKATVTRAEACAMIARMMLGRDAADRLPVGDVKFNDVSLESWEGRMAKYIAFCWNRKIVIGDGDGNFRPNDPVKGTELAVMLLRALGYGVMGEYEGKGWDVNAVADALYYKIFEDSEVKDFSVAATREETALYIFNTLWVDLVAYDVDIDHYVLRLGTFASEVYDLERIRGAQVMANQATGDPYTVIRYTVTEYEKDEKGVLAPVAKVYTENLDYESGKDLIAHEVTVYRNIDKQYKDKDNNWYWKTYLLQDDSKTVFLSTAAAAYKLLRDENRTNLDAPWNDTSRVQNWMNYVYISATGGLKTSFATINDMKGWETKSLYATVVLDSEGHLLACLNTEYHVDEVKKIVGDEVYLRDNDYKDEWETYDLALCYEGIAKGDYVTVQPVGKLCYLLQNSTQEITVTERSYWADHYYPYFNDMTVAPGMGYMEVTPPDSVDPWTVQAGDKVLFYLDAYGAYYATQILERGTLDGVVYVNYVFTKSGEGDYGDDDIVVYAQCVNEKGEEVIYKLNKDDYKEEVEAAADAEAAKEAALTKMRGLKEGQVFKAYLDKKGYATLTKSSDLGVLDKLEGKTSYLTKDGGTYYVTKDTMIYYVNNEKSDMKVTKSKNLPAPGSYKVCAQFTSNGTTWNTTVLWIKNENAPKSSDSYVYVAGVDTKVNGEVQSVLENTGTELVDGKKTYYFGVYKDGAKPNFKIFVEIGNENVIIDEITGYVYLKSGFYIYNEDVVDGKNVYDLERLDPAEENPVIKVQDNVILENGDVKDNKWYYEANGEKTEATVVVLDKKKCVTWDGKRYLSFTELSDIGDFLDDTAGNTVTVSYLATKVGDNYVPFGTIYIISATEKEP